MKKISRKADASEYGFGANTTAKGQRLVNSDGSANVIRLGEPRFQLINIFHSLISMSWTKFNLLVLFAYMLANLFFACLYHITSDVELNGIIYHNSDEKFMEEFFFSAQTLSTVGYGRLNPVGPQKSTIAAIESMVGLMGFALITGLLYGRFSRPTSKLIFSNTAVIAPFKDTKAFMFRLANARRNQLIEVEAQLAFSYNEEVNGKIMRRYQELKIDLSRISTLAMTWTIVHPINADSPLSNLSKEDLESIDAEFLISMKAIDDTYAQQVHQRTSYKWNEIVWNAKFISAIGLNSDGVTTIDLSKVNDYELV